ncbi:DUF4340 domain-containing protein [Paludisphaera rhizosphaerae]|uniref:DUF4340 domain-containing protein n=1 Tax=Paludisphaera rhizosphaerae TaxID=2711216 RepID=UPI0013EB5C99|nr:DUF4340 domain-containing protein [Paludisphaera rhizosphaerae]
MRRERSTYVLLGLFFATLVGLWGLERSGLLTEAERDRRRDRVLPELLDVRPGDVRRIEIAHGGERLVFDRRGARGWRLTEPLDVDATPEEVDALAATLRGLRKSPEAGRVDGAETEYGLAPPEAVVRVWTDPSQAPAATLELGRPSHEERFVRAGGNAEIMVVPRRVLAIVDRPLVEWRETAVVPSWTAPFAAVSVRRPDLDVTAERRDGGTWRITTPVDFPADASAVERVVASLSTLQVDPKAGGFVADHVHDFVDYGLDPPAATIELKPFAAGVPPLVLMVGATVPQQKDRVYLRIGGRDDVLSVDSAFVAKLPADLKAMRNRFVAQVAPAAVRRIEIESPGGPFRLERDRQGWSASAPTEARADRERVEALLKAVADLQSSEFFEPGAVPDPKLDPPLRRLKIWTVASDGKATDKPSFSLALGRHDILRKVVFGQVDGDKAILALPDVFLSALPSNAFAFRDRNLPAVQPSNVVRLTIVRPGRTTDLSPSPARDTPNAWRMTEPVAAGADMQAVTAALARLADLQVSEYLPTPDAGDEDRYGLRKPAMEVRWATSAANGQTTTHTLKIGSPVKGDSTKYYGSLSDFPVDFSINAESLIPFTAEFHDTRVLSFRPQSVRRLVLETETRTLAYTRRMRAGAGTVAWSPEAGTPTQGVDLSRFDSLVAGLSDLRTQRYLQYEGAYPPGAGLDRPRLTITAELEGSTPPVKLRIGSKFLDNWVCAATSDGRAGPAFLLVGPVWEAMILGAEGGLPPIPDMPFAPMPSP